MRKITRKIIHIDENLCDGCGLCIPSCPEQAIQLVETPDGKKARLVKDIYCDGLGACLGNCPTGALTIEEREADPYDDGATIQRIQEVAPEMLDIHKKHLEEHADEMAAQAAQTPAPQQFSCPSAQMSQWTHEEEKEQETSNPRIAVRSELRQWPVQLHLVSPHAPYFKNADLVVVADCVPFAFANFHQEFVKGSAIVIGCPKFDDVQAYLAKLTQIIKIAQPKSMTVVNMEVPCCFGLARVVERAVEMAGVDVPSQTVTISIKGEKLV